MEKWPVYDAKERVGEAEDCGRRDTQRRRRSHLLFVVHFALFGVLLLCFKSQLWLLFFGVDSRAMTQQRAFDLKVGSVQWGKCSDAFDPRLECGYLAAPLDYFDAASGTAYIALTRLPADASTRKGSVLVNPGGPGGSGTQFVGRLGEHIQYMLGGDYDIVGFDPRGIGDTVPRTKCFPDPNFRYRDFAGNTILTRSYDIASNLSAVEIRTILLANQRDAEALLKTQFEVCNRTMGDTLRYMGTSTVVRDMDLITRALEGDDALINYWGGSYGSILGLYLVNMLPNRVGRVAIDGIADAVAWANEPYFTWYKNWLSNTTDTYRILTSRCSEVGPDACALASSQGEDPVSIESRIENFVDSLYYQPLDVPDAEIPGTLTSGRLRMWLLRTLQIPMTWPQAAQALAEAMGGNGTAILNSPIFTIPSDLHRPAVSCNDNKPFTPPTPETVIDESLNVFHNVTRLVFATITTEPDAGCQYWPVTPPERFLGPWNHTLRNPMLIVSNTADPVTPISSGVLAQRLLGESARLLVQDGPGHCSLAMPSSCTVDAVRAYFANGTLPKPGTICPLDFQPFDTPEQAVSEGRAISVEKHVRLAKLFAEVRSGMLERGPVSDVTSMFSFS